MSQYIITVTAKASTNITYRFKCSKCGKDGVIKIPIEESITVTNRSHRNVNVEEFKVVQQEKVNCILKDKLSRIKIMPIIKKCELIGIRGQCPQCKEFQPWSKIGFFPEPPSIKACTITFFLIGGVITIIMGIFGKFYDNAGFFLILPSVITSIIGFVIGKILKNDHNKRKNIAINEFQKIPENELPMIIVPEI
jgi:hypothetical protein